MQQQARWLAAERYEVGEVVGRGGYGMVCRGVDVKTGQPVALKMLSPEAARDADVVERMLREQQALVALSGTCAVTAIDLCRLDSGAPCLVMEWLDGCDLEQQLSAWEASGHLPSTQDLLSILAPLTQTLERAHDIGIVHRDIKPANIFLTRDDDPGVRLLDFGLSRMKSSAPLTAVGMVMGSPSYIAPETWRGNSAALDGRADLYALAVIVFRWLTGKLPFDVPDLIGKMTAVTSGPRPSAVALRPELPAAVDAWFSRALAIEAGDRFQTGGEFFAALAAALRGEMWPTRQVVVPGVRPLEATERKSALTAAWQAASSLLKRFTVPRERIAPKAAPATVAPPPSVLPTLMQPPPRFVVSPPEPAPADADRKTIWLDSEELEDAPESFVEGSVAPTVTAPPTAEAKAEAERSTRAAPRKRKHQQRPKAKVKAKRASKKSKPAKRKARKA